jgi:Domain of unknown function (DUF4406)
MNIYISGKITNLPKEIYTAKFQAAENEIEAAGHNAYNPVSMVEHWLTCEVISDPIEERNGVMRLLVSDMLSLCDAIYLLHDWQESAGAIDEYEVARRFGLKILFQHSNDLKKL